MPVSDDTEHRRRDPRLAGRSAPVAPDGASRHRPLPGPLGRLPDVRPRLRRSAPRASAHRCRGERRRQGSSLAACGIRERRCARSASRCRREPRPGRPDDGHAGGLGPPGRGHAPGGFRVLPPEHARRRTSPRRRPRCLDRRTRHGSRTGCGNSPPSWWSGARHWIDRPPPLELRLSEPPAFLGGGSSSTTRSHWMRPPRPVGGDQLLQAALLAYGSDFFLMDMIFRAHPSAMGPGRANGYSVDHAIWFHRPVQFDDWLLHTQEAVAVLGDRGLARGAIHDQAGRLVATVMQEVLVRPRVRPMIDMLPSSLRAGVAGRRVPVLPARIRRRGPGRRGQEVGDRPWRRTVPRPARRRAGGSGTRRTRAR